MTEEFVGFTQDSFNFFRDLAINNNTSWFKANRERYDQHVVGAFRGLLASLEPFLMKINPDFETAGKTNGNFSRINRDIRFRKDKSPYKSNFYLYLYDGNRKRGDAGRFYVGLNADCVTAGFSIYGSAESAKRQKEGHAAHSALESIFRKRFLGNRAALERILQNRLRNSGYETYWHRLEKGDWSQHAGLPKHDEDWLTMQAWVIRKVFLPNARSVSSPAFVRKVQEIIADLYPLYAFTTVPSAAWQREVKRKL